MKSKFKRINITIPEEDLKKIDDFCANENINRSEFIREASSNFIAFKNEQKEKVKIQNDRIKAFEIMEDLRKKSTLTGGTEIIRKYREQRNNE